MKFIIDSYDEFENYKFKYPKSVKNQQETLTSFFRNFNIRLEVGPEMSPTLQYRLLPTIINYSYYYILSLKRFQA